MSYIANYCRELLCLRKAPKAIVPGKTQFWYGRVNSWSCKSKSLLRRDLDLCCKYGVSGYTIELVGWTDLESNPSTYRTKEYFSRVERTYKYLVKACRARGLWLFVSVVNDNAGRSGKNPYNPRLEKQQENVQFAFDLVKKCGAKNVIVQPVAEIQTDYGKTIDKTWMAEFNRLGFETVYNGEGRPTKNEHGSKWFAVHPASERAAVPTGSIVVSDHSLLLRKLCKGGDINGMGNATALKSWKSFYRDTYHVPVVCFYHYNYDGSKGSDKESIKAMGR